MQVDRRRNGVSCAMNNVLQHGIETTYNNASRHLHKITDKATLVRPDLKILALSGSLLLQ